MQYIERDLGVHCKCISGIQDIFARRYSQEQDLQESFGGEGLCCFGNNSEIVPLVWNSRLC